MDGFNVAYSMNEWMDGWMVWHITVVAMFWQEIQNLNYS
jgi:hypothetical protein